MQALHVEDVTYSYGNHRALDGLDLSVEAQEIFAILGPNGSGKSTLFKLCCTLGTVQKGSLSVFGHCVNRAPHEVRNILGIVFQNPSLDGKLTVKENIECQGILYGLSGNELRKRISEVSSLLGIDDRLADYAESLSGGLKRRVELAKGILHRPKLLLLDEPSTGLDPSARLDLWQGLENLRSEAGVTVILTTHLLEEAEKADRIAILDFGKCAAFGSPQELRAGLGSQILSIRCQDTAEVARWIQTFSSEAEIQQIDDLLRISGSKPANLLAPLNEKFGHSVVELNLAQPSLEDVFTSVTGHQFFETTQDRN